MDAISLTRVLTIMLVLGSTCLTLNASEIIKFSLFDGETVEGKLSLSPDTQNVRELVIYVHGTGPATYDNHRKFGTLELNYFDYFAQEFNRRGIAFFTYNKRVVTLGTDPPLYDRVDREKFRKGRTLDRDKGHCHLYQHLEKGQAAKKHKGRASRMERRLGDCSNGCGE